MYSKERIDIERKLNYKSTIIGGISMDDPDLEGAMNVTTFLSILESKFHQKCSEYRGSKDICGGNVEYLIKMPDDIYYDDLWYTIIEKRGEWETDNEVIDRLKKEESKRQNKIKKLQKSRESLLREQQKIEKELIKIGVL